MLGRERLFSECTPVRALNFHNSHLNCRLESWAPQLSTETQSWIVSKTGGYCGADLKALCAEASLISLRRAFPQVYDSSVRLALNTDKLFISRGDFAAALNKVIPSSRREVGSPAKPLTLLLQPLLESKLEQATELLRAIFPPARAALRGEDRHSSLINDDEAWYASIVDIQNDGPSTGDFSAVGSVAKLLISGRRDMGQREVASALLQRLEGFSCYPLELPSLISDHYASSVEQSLVQRIGQAYKNTPSVLYLPDIGNWWMTASEGLRTLLMSLIESTPHGLPLLWIGTLVDLEETPVASNSMENHDSIEISRDSDALDDERLRTILQWFGGRDSKLRTTGVHEVVILPPSLRERMQFFSTFFESISSLPSTVYAARVSLLQSKATKLEPAADCLGPVAVEQANEMANEEREKNCLRELRNFFRTVLHVLYKEKRFSVFCKPVDPEAVPDYYDVIKYPMDLETIRMKIDEGCYTTYAAFLCDIERILFNAKEYNPLVGKDSRGKNIVHAAHSMLDHVESHAYSFKRQLGYDLFKRCETIARRKGTVTVLFDPEASMAELDLRYYRVILERHETLKREIGDEHPGNKGASDPVDVDRDEPSSDPGTAVCVETRRSSSRRRGEEPIITDAIPVSKPKAKRSVKLADPLECAPAMVHEENVVMELDAVNLPINVETSGIREEIVQLEVPVAAAEKLDLEMHPDLTSLRQSIEAADKVLSALVRSRFWKLFFIAHPAQPY